MKQLPECEKYSRNKVESYIEQKCNNSATNFTNLLADTSIYNVFKNQQQYIDNATEKLTPEAEDKMRQQKGVSAAFDQMEEVRKKYYGTDKWLKAPNGKDTNLTERQWIQVRTPNFKEWFGDWENDPQNASKVVDKNGEPMVVYHGSRTAGFSKFSEFDGEKQSNAPYGSFWFSDSEYVARSYSGTSKLVENYVDLSEISEDYDSEYGLPYEDLGNEPANYACFLNIRQPYYQDFEGQNWSGDIKGAYTLEAKNEFGEWEQVYNNHGGQLFNTKEEAEERAKARGDNEYEIRENGWLGFDTNSEVDNAMNDGYFDGAILKNVDDQGGRDYADVANDYVIFDPNQAKSAVDNTGDFGVGDDIRYQQSATPLNQTIQGRTEPALIKSSFRFDNDTGKYFISGDVYNEIVEVMRSSFPIVNNTVETEVRKTATLATAFLTSLSDDTQDALVRKSATATGGKFLTDGNENLLRLFFNMNELKDTKGVNEYTKGLSLSQSAKIILGINSDESTIRHEGTHIIWWADSSFRERAQTEFKKYFEQDSDGKEIRAVVEANLDRFGGYNADQVIAALKNLIREDYDSFQLKKLLPAWAKCTWKARIRLSTVKGLEVSLNGWLIS